jgi:hypothetical protein
MKSLARYIAQIMAHIERLGQAGGVPCWLAQRCGRVSCSNCGSLTLRRVWVVMGETVMADVVCSFK